MNNFKKAAVLMAAAVMSVSLFSGCFDEEEENGIVRKGEDDTSADVSVNETSDQNLTADSASDSQTGGKRSKRTKITGTDDKFTVMVYMCGTDLESKWSAATNDIMEMVAADLNDNINLLIYTGGTEDWQNSYISSSTNQIWKAEHEDLVCVEDNMGKKAMTSPDTLEEFVAYCGENYPANRNALIMWDHGGGALWGFGSDEIFGGEAMRIDQIDSALSDAGVKFDFIGFDACLMATVETACMIDRHADYMIASEETEPGTGWFYTNWLNAIASDPSTPTVEFGKIIVDDFIQESIEADKRSECTLSIIDLTEMGNVSAKLDAFSADAMNKLENREFNVVSHSVGNTKAYADGEYDTIDLMHFAQNLDLPSSKELIKSIDSAVVYYANSKNIKNSNGMTVYFPYNDLESFNGMMKVYDHIGMGTQFTDFVKAFANMRAGGQIYNTSSSNPFFDDDGSGEDDLSFWSVFDWFDDDYVSSYEDDYSEYSYDSEDLEVEDRGDYYALTLSDEDWEVISDIKMQMFMDDGECYIDMGTDDYFELDDDDALIVDFDGLWFSLGDYMVSLSIVESDEDYTEGRIPCLLNGEEVELVVVWDEYDSGYIAGAVGTYDNGMSQKGLIPVEDGDIIQLLCDCYTYGGDYDDNYLFSDEFEYDSSMYVEYYPVGDCECLIYYVITDIYGNTYYTEDISLTFSDDYFEDFYAEYYGE